MTYECNYEEDQEEKFLAEKKKLPHDSDSTREAMHQTIGLTDY